jgi:hypothetical protein
MTRMAEPETVVFPGPWLAHGEMLATGERPNL